MQPTAAPARKIAASNKPRTRGLATRSLRNPCDGYLKNLRAWFLYPAKLPCRADPLDPMTALRSFIADHYIPVKQVGSWLVMRRIGNASPAQHDH
jgi:hypothetical protein